MSPQAALRQDRAPHVHALNETCPVCDQPIPNERLKEVQARIEARERSQAEAAAQQLAAERAKIEAAAKAAIAEKAEAARAEIEALKSEQETILNRRIAQARATFQKEATDAIAAAEKRAADAEQAASARDAETAEKLAAAAAETQEARAEIQSLKDGQESVLNERIQQARTDFEKEISGTIAAAEKRVADTEQAAAARDAASAERLAAAVAETEKMRAEFQTLKDGQDALLAARVRETREALEKDKADSLAAATEKHDAETRKLSEKLEIMQRQIDKQRADELGEGAEVKLFDALQAEFPGDNIRRISKGVSGADILHTVVHGGKECGTIIYDSKNSMAWRDDYVAKLIRDQTAAKAEQAVLSTFKFPAGASQVEIRDNVVIVNPARAIAIVRMIRKHMILVQTLRLSKSERSKKMAALYDFITSERCFGLLDRIDSDAESLLDLQVSEKKAHENHWKKEGLLLRSIQKGKADLETEIDLIVGGEPAGG